MVVDNTYKNIICMLCGEVRLKCIVWKLFVYCLRRILVIELVDVVLCCRCGFSCRMVLVLR